MARKNYAKLLADLIASGRPDAETELQESRDFWDDRDCPAVQAAIARFVARFQRIVGYVAERWGPPDYQGSFFASPFPA